MPETKNLETETFENKDSQEEEQYSMFEEFEDEDVIKSF